jgi:hypothetical protein
VIAQAFERLISVAEPPLECPGEAVSQRPHMADCCLMQSPSTIEQSPAQYVGVAGAAPPSIEPVGAAVVGSEASGRYLDERGGPIQSLVTRAIASDGTRQDLELGAV